MMKTNNLFVKLLVSLLIVLTLVNFIGSTNVSVNYSFADTEEGEERTNSLLGGLLSNLVDAIVNAIKAIILAPFRAARSINYLLASSGGVVGGVPTTEISPFDIFFNRFTLLDANIFSTTDRDGNELDHDSLVYKIRTNAAVWYYAIRTIAIAIIAIMLLWNLIRAISKNTSADQKVVAKNALTDWVLSFALVMFMHIIIIVVLNFNDLLLDGIQSFTPFSDTGDFFDALENAVFSSNLILGIASLIVYALLNWQTLKYILVYIQRFLTIVLLVMISPIVPITYSTYRMRGGRGAALNGWLKELLFNVFIQVLHATVYAALVGVAMSALTSSNSITGFGDLGTALVAITAMLFVKYAERMVKTIFGFDSSQVLNTNVVSEAVTNVGHAAVSVARTGQRIAMGGAMGAAGMGAPGLGNGVSFGQNIGGANGIGMGAPGAGGIGSTIGQTFRGIGNNIRTAGSSFMDGLRGGSQAGQNGGQGVAGQIGSQIGGILGVGNGADDNGSIEASAEAEARASAEAEATARDGEDGEDGQAAGPIIIGGGAYVDVAQEDTDDNQNATIKKNKTEADNKIQGVIDQINNREKEENKETQENKESGTVTNIEEHQKDVTEEDTKIEEHSEETTEFVNGEPNADANVNANDPIPVVLGGGTSPELLDELKEGIEAIKNEDNEKLEELALALNKQLEEIGEDLDKKTKEDIETNVENLLKDPKALGEYINSLPEDSDERKYAEAFARFNAYMDISDENITGKMSAEEKADMLMGAYTSQGLELPENVTIDNVSNLQAVLPKDGSGDELTNGSNTSDSNVVPMSNNTSQVDMAEGSGTRVINLKDGAIQKAQEALLKLGVDVKDETELQADFEARIEQMEATTKMKDPSMDDIIKSLDSQGQREYRDFKSGKIGLDGMQNQGAINAVALEREARALQMIEQQAKREGFNMEVTNTNYEGTISINGKKETFHSSSAEGVIREIQSSKKRNQSNVIDIESLKNKQKLA